MLDQESMAGTVQEPAKLSMTDSSQKPDLLSVSIVMPSYNRRERLEKVMQHLAGQNYPTDLIEVLVCLDGCTDGSADMLREMQGNYPMRLVILEQPQSGPAAARNRAIRTAQNEVIVFVDDDVFPVPSFLQEHIKHHIAEPKLVVMGPMQPPDDFERPFWVRWEEVMLVRQYNDMMAGVYEPSCRQFYTGNTSVRRKWLLELGDLFDESFKRAEDIELAYRLDVEGLKFDFEPKAIGYHYATRSYQSWETARYLYGKYDVIIVRDKGHTWVGEMIEIEQQKRSLITRLVCNYAVGKIWYKPVKNILFGLSKGLFQIKQEKWSYKALSTLANMVYWQGYQDELKRRQAK